jgi:hypothetical protein
VVTQAKLGTAARAPTRVFFSPLASNLSDHFAYTAASDLGPLDRPCALVGIRRPGRNVHAFHPFGHSQHEGADGPSKASALDAWVPKGLPLGFGPEVSVISGACSSFGHAFTSVSASSGNDPWLSSESYDIVVGSQKEQWSVRASVRVHHIDRKHHARCQTPSEEGSDVLALRTLCTLRQGLVLPRPMVFHGWGRHQLVSRLAVARVGVEVPQVRLQGSHLRYHRNTWPCARYTTCGPGASEWRVRPPGLRTMRAET